jgi:carboxypeptidase Taq
MPLADRRPPRAYTQLERRFDRIGRLRAAEAVLFWDSRTIMPPGAAPGRSQVLAGLREQMHELIADPSLDRMFDAAAREANALDVWQRANLAEMQRLRAHATSLSPRMIAALSDASSAAQMTWTRARSEESFAPFRDALARLIDLAHESGVAKAQALGVSPLDAALDECEPGLRAARIAPLFDELATFLPGFVAEAEARTRDVPSIEMPLDEAGQRALSERVLATIGYVFERGRLDTTSHPFALADVPGDYRITTRFDETGLLFGLMATIHEAGHAFYEAGLPERWQFQPVGRACGGVLHESQSLLFEMQASRSDAFLGWLAGTLQDVTGDARFSIEAVRASYRRVQRGTVRLEADAATYPLHIILRYRLERQLFDGTLDVDDVPEAWNETTRTLLGCVPDKPSRGCLQDVHWSLGMFGYFPSYSLGALAAAQMFRRAVQQQDIADGLTRGDLKPLRAWAQDKVHKHGRSATAFEIIRRATGEELGTAAFKAQLQERYGG